VERRARMAIGSPPHVQHAGHTGHEGDTSSPAPADPTMRTTAPRAPATVHVVSEAPQRPAAAQATTARGGRSGASRDAHAPVHAIQAQGRLAPPRPSGTASPASSAPAMVGTASADEEARRRAEPVAGVLRDLRHLHGVHDMGVARLAHMAAPQTQDAVALGDASLRTRAQSEEGAGVPERPAAQSFPRPAAGPSPAASPSPAAGPSPAAAMSPQGSDSLPGVAGQLVRVLTPQQSLADGSSTVTVALDPPSLGLVKATVVAGVDRLSVQLVTTTAAGAEALRLALPDLKSALVASGQQVQVTVSDGSASTSEGLSSAPQGGGGQSAFTSRHPAPSSQSPPRSPSHPASTVPRTTALPRAPTASSSHLVDIRI